MGNGPSSTIGKVILSDGTVHMYDKHVTVAELMLEYPQQVVVEFQSAVTDKRPCPLPADKKLETEKVYVMIPIKPGKPATLSSEDARKILFRANSVLKSKPLLTGFIPLFARICASGTGEEHGLVVQRKEKLVLEKQEDEEMTKTEFLSEIILEGRPEYLSRQFSGKGWKPSLDTIKEKSLKRKVRHWLFF